MLDPIDVRVDRGIALLDEFYGRSEWLDAIDLATFELEACTHCIVGQVVYHLGMPVAWDKSYVELTFWEFVDGPLMDSLSEEDRADYSAKSLITDYGFDKAEWENYRDVEEVWVAEIEAMRRESQR